MPSPRRRIVSRVWSRGVGFEVGQAGGLGGLGDLRGDDVEDPAADAAELLRPELGGPLDEVRLGPGDRVGVHAGGERGRVRGRSPAPGPATPHPRASPPRVPAGHGRTRPRGAGRLARRRTASGCAAPTIPPHPAPPSPAARSPASARIRSRSSTSWASAATSSRSATAFSSTAMNVGFVSATALSEARTSEAAAMIGCTGHERPPSTTGLHAAHTCGRSTGRHQDANWAEALVAHLIRGSTRFY